jgi:hypothetical protein
VNLGAGAELERNVIRERILAGLEHARAVTKRLIDESRRTLRLVDAAARIHTPRNISQRATYASNCSTKKETKRGRAKFRPPLACCSTYSTPGASSWSLQTKRKGGLVVDRVSNGPTPPYFSSLKCE